MTTTRREFLTGALRSTAVVSLASTAPTFLLKAAAMGESRGESILVVVQLTGGNDGLNTIVPYADDEYRRNRPKLGISTDQVLKINDYSGFHPSMRGFADLLEAGKASILQGVGYDHPNRSHFESMDIWHTCRSKNEDRPDGWLGRFLDSIAAGGRTDVPALHLGGEKQPLALAARKVRTPSIRSLESFRLKDASEGQLATAIEKIAAAERALSNDLLTFVQSSTTSALSASKSVERAAGSYKSGFPYPDSDLAQKLRTVAQLIDAGLGTRIYYVMLDGFDTHSQQPAAHAGLLRDFSSSVAAFVKDLDAHGHGQRTMVMSFSEFGRRVQENASEGTDHGAAAPMFFAGAKLKPGLIGSHPSLTDLDDGDIKSHTDFRRVYAAVVEKWLGWKSEPILGAKYPPVDFIRT